MYRRPSHAGPGSPIAATAVAFLLAAACAPSERDSELPFSLMAARIVEALDPVGGEPAILRYNPQVMPGLAEELGAALEDRGVSVRLLSYEPVAGFSDSLAPADIYVWLPAGNMVTAPDELAALAGWLDAGAGRQVHFHWGAGTVALDGLGGEHSSRYDSVYVAALDIDYAELNRVQSQAINRLRAGAVSVTTPSGTSVSFRIGDRPFNQQDGDASVARMASAAIRIDREIELPAGVVRVAPIETSVGGTLVIPQARFGNATVEGLRIEFARGRISAYSAARGEEAFQAALTSDSSLNYFREFALGFNSKLVAPEGERWLPYFGYGAGVVRLSLGDNTELGGTVRGGAVRWFFFDDATVTVDGDVVVEGGALR